MKDWKPVKDNNFVPIKIIDATPPKLPNDNDYRHKIEVLNRALDKAVDLAYEYRTEADTLSCSSCPMFRIFDSCKERGLYKDCAKRWKECLLRESEEEVIFENENQEKEKE